MGLLVNRAKCLTATTGTGIVTIGAAVVPFQTWIAAGASIGVAYDYLIEDGTAWEIGVGVYNGTQLTRPGPGVDSTFASSTGALINLSGTATIACVANKDTLVGSVGRTMIHAKGYRNAALTLTASAWTSMVLDGEEYDVGSFFDPATGRFTPNQAGYYLVVGRIRTATTGGIATGVFKNGAVTVGLGGEVTSGTQAVGGAVLIYCNGTTDYLQLGYFSSSARAVTLGTFDTYMEVSGPFLMNGGGQSGLAIPMSATTTPFESTSSTAYVDLATAGPAVTMITGTDVLITLSAACSKESTSAGFSGLMAVAVSGATTLAAADANGWIYSATWWPGTGYQITQSRTFKLSGLTAGNNTFTAKYRVNGLTYGFANRDITVQRLN